MHADKHLKGAYLEKLRSVCGWGGYVCSLLPPFVLLSLRPHSYVLVGVCSELICQASPLIRRLPLITSLKLATP